ncbi:eukaryotic translation initiation factor 3 subunit J [Periplaneta americana]|uniref:eukaryotic translation initiation factor 3 subunit J n=1 Tax=Periplaneta americana TaxID=6978 RepID=UPI0037E84682
MDEEWDADTFEPPEIKTTPSVGANKWEGEDEDEDVKDNWEDEEEEEKKDVEKQETAKPMQVKKNKKTLAEKIEEKELRQLEEAEKKAKAREVKRELTAEEIQEEKIRQQKLQEESDLRVAMETFGIGETSTVSGIDAMNPNTKEEFDELQQAISKKVQLYTKSAHFPIFAEDLIRNICANLGSQDLKKLKTTVENMFLEKSKAEKGDKAKKSKGKGKVKLKVEGDHALVNEYSAYGDLDDYDDFM